MVRPTKPVLELLLTLILSLLIIWGISRVEDLSPAPGVAGAAPSDHPGSFSPEPRDFLPSKKSEHALGRKLLMNTKKKRPRTKESAFYKVSLICGAVVVPFLALVSAVVHFVQYWKLKALEEPDFRFLAISACCNWFQTSVATFKWMMMDKGQKSSPLYAEHAAFFWLATVLCMLASLIYGVICSRISAHLHLSFAVACHLLVSCCAPFFAYSFVFGHYELAYNAMIFVYAVSVLFPLVARYYLLEDDDHGPEIFPCPFGDVFFRFSYTATFTGCVAWIIYSLKAEDNNLHLGISIICVTIIALTPFLKLSVGACGDSIPQRPLTNNEQEVVEMAQRHIQQQQREPQTVTSRRTSPQKPVV